MLTLLCADFWGPVSNFGIPIAAIADMSKDPEMYVSHTHTPIHYAQYTTPLHTQPRTSYTPTHTTQYKSLN